MQKLLQRSGRMAMTEDQYKELIKIYGKFSVTEMICLECQRFQYKHGKHPSMMALNLALKPRLTDEEISSFCAPIGWFKPTQFQTLISQPDKDWIMLADETGKFIQFL